MAWHRGSSRASLQQTRVWFSSPQKIFINSILRRIIDNTVLLFIVVGEQCIKAHNVFCSTSLLFASTRWVRSSINYILIKSFHCPLYNQRALDQLFGNALIWTWGCWVRSENTIQCAMQPPFPSASSIHQTFKWMKTNHLLQVSSSAPWIKAKYWS